MKYLNKNILFAFVAGFAFLASCQKDSHDMGDLVSPTNLTVSSEIVGADTLNPNGDGSGMVNFTASADNAITYTYDFGDGKDAEVAPDGKITHQYSITGVVNYTVKVKAVGTGGLSTTKTSSLKVYSSFEDKEAVDLLTGGSSKTWYWAHNEAGFVGLGPTDEDYGNLDYTWASWWSIGANDSAKACMYDAEFVFTKTGNGVTYEQTTGPAFIPGAYADVIGVEGDVCHGQDDAPALYGVKNVSFSPSSSRASVDGDYRGTSFTISDGGFMCWWVGTSEYDIISISESKLMVRIKQDDTFSWYHTFTSVKPE